MNPDVSVVIISWKMRTLLEVVLSTINKFTSGISYELILIDNDSQDGTAEMIKTNFPDAVLVENKHNLGVAPARNQGLKIARGKYILILDADMEFVDNTIEKLFDFMEANKDCGLVGAKLTEPDGTLQYTCKRYPTFSALFFRRLDKFSFFKNSKQLKEHIMADWAHDEVKDVDYVIGACQFFRKEVMDKIGYYDDTIFYGPEDLDYCMRIWRAGWKVYYYPHTRIIHHEQRITKKNFFSKITYKHLLGIIHLFRKYNFRLSRSL